MTNIDKTVVSTEKRFPYIASIWSGLVFSVVNRPIRNYYMTVREEKITELEIATNLCRRKKKKSNTKLVICLRITDFSSTFKLNPEDIYFLLNIHPYNTQEPLKVERMNQGVFCFSLL